MYLFKSTNVSQLCMGLLPKVTNIWWHIKKPFAQNQNKHEEEASEAAFKKGLPLEHQ